MARMTLADCVLSDTTASNFCTAVRYLSASRCCLCCGRWESTALASEICPQILCRCCIDSSLLSRIMDTTALPHGSVLLNAGGVRIPAQTGRVSFAAQTHTHTHTYSKSTPYLP